MIDSLFAGDFDTYVQTMRADPRPFLHIHVPKTAGSSLNGEMAAVLGGDYNIHIDGDKSERDYFGKYEHAIDIFLEKTRTRHYRYISGHLFVRWRQRIEAALGPLFVFAFVRDPVARFVSDYRYQCSPMHPDRNGFIERFPTIERYLEQQKGDSNKIARYLAPIEMVRAGNVQGCVDFVLGNYGFLGVQEMYPLCLRLLTTLAGAPRRPTVRKRVNEATEESRVELAPALEAEIRRANAIDCAIVDAVRARMQAIEDPLVAWLDATAPLPER